MNNTTANTNRTGADMESPFWYFAIASFHASSPWDFRRRCTAWLEDFSHLLPAEDAPLVARLVADVRNWDDVDRIATLGKL